MAKRHDMSHEQGNNTFASAPVSRRDFLKLAGVAGAAVGLGTGLGGLVAACGGGEETTTSGPVTTAAGPTTSVAANVETGRELKVGWVTMTTGIFAALSEPDDFLLKQAKDAVGDGIVSGDGKKHPLTWVVKDSQSDTNRSAEVTGELITTDNVDMVIGGMTPFVANPVADQCEANGVPCVTYGCPWDAWFDGRGGDRNVGFKWTFDYFQGASDVINVYSGLCNLVQSKTNKTIGLISANDPDGEYLQKQFPSAMTAQGYKIIDTGLYTGGTEDYSSVISQFKSGGAEIIVGMMNNPDFISFWSQMKQQGLKPKLMVTGRAVLTRPDIEAVGAIGAGVCTDVWWSAAYPWKSSLTGLTCQQLADAWEQEKNKGYNAALGLTGSAFEVAVDVLKRTQNPDDPQSIVDAIKATDMVTVFAPVKWAGGPAPNVCQTPLVGGQWQQIGKWGWDNVVVDNSNYPDIPVAGQLIDLP